MCRSLFCCVSHISYSIVTYASLRSFALLLSKPVWWSWRLTWRSSFSNTISECSGSHVALVIGSVFRHHPGLD